MLKRRLIIHLLLECNNGLIHCRVWLTRSQDTPLLSKRKLQSMLEMPRISAQRLTLAEILEGLWQVSTVTEGIFPVISLR
jgi:hypothetical protein